MRNEEFEEFFVGKGLSIEEITDLISPYAEIDVEESRIAFREEYSNADIKIQLLVPLLALHLFEQAGEVESAAIDPIQLAELTDYPIGKAYPVIRELEQSGAIENVGKQYRIVPDSDDRIRTQFEPDTEPAD